MSSAALRRLLDAPGLTRLPGVYDAVSALLAARAGARGVHLSGAAVSAVELGLPDLGFVHGGEIAQRAAVLASVLRERPVLADADTGYGNPLQARHTVRRYAAAGVAGLHLEDQASPKRCGHLAGKQLVDVDEAAARVAAAVAAGTGVVVVARTDAFSVEGRDGVLARCRAFAEAGADALFVEGADLETLAAVHDAVPHLPQVVNVSEAGGVGPAPDPAALTALGVRLAIHPVSGLLAAAAAQARVFASILGTGDAGPTDRLTWDELTDLVGLPEQLHLEKEYVR